MSKNSVQYYAEATAEDYCPMCNHRLIRNMWDEKKGLFDECFNCGYVREGTTTCDCPE